jgi:two-component system NtrC family response regulator
MADGARVSSDDLGLAAPSGVDGNGDREVASFDLRQAREAAERQVVLAALARTAGNMARTSELLGVSRPTLYDLINRLSIRQQIES